MGLSRTWACAKGCLWCSEFVKMSVGRVSGWLVGLHVTLKHQVESVPDRHVSYMWRTIFVGQGNTAVLHKKCWFSFYHFANVLID